MNCSRKKTSYAPHPGKRPLLRKEPPPEGKPWNKADNFCLIVRKHDEARGSREAADNFCRKK